jgi:arginine/serine-rich splicing factor 4/5/6
MTQLYVGNLSADGDEKAIRALFSRYGVVREVLMKNGYAFVEFEDACSAETAMRDLNGELVHLYSSACVCLLISNWCNL